MEVKNKYIHTYFLFTKLYFAELLSRNLFLEGQGQSVDGH